MLDSAADHFYDRDAIFHDNGPFDPLFVDEMIRTLFRAMPIDPDEPVSWTARRLHAALRGIAALHPRDEIEMMLAVQAMCAFYAAGAAWRIGMNQSQPNGEATRHLSAAGGATRTFDTVLRALERRQAKPLSVPVGRPAPRVWPEQDANRTVQYWEARCRRQEDVPPPEPKRPASEPPVAWTVDALSITRRMREREQQREENAGLDIENTEGILPGGGMIVPADATPAQEAYMARRLGLMYRREYEDNLRKGIRSFPKIRPIRTGDFIP